MRRCYRTLCVICLIATVICIPCSLFMATWRFGLYFFAALCACTALMCKLIAVRDTETGTKQRISKWLVRLGHVLFVVWLCSFVAIEGMIVSGTRSEVQEPVQVIYVLGGGLRGDQPSQNLKNRLAVAMDVMERNPDAPVIVCGGQGLDEAEPEAVVMRRWMVQHGADSSRIIMEKQSHNTVQNIQNAGEICRQRGWSTEHVTIVSSSFHLFRVRHIMQHIGLTPSVVSAPAGDPASSVLMYIREYFSVVKLIVSGYW